MIQINQSLQQENGIKINDLSSSQYSNNRNIRFKTPMLRSDLSDYSDAYIVIKGTITFESTSANNRRNKELVFKNNAPFRPLTPLNQ